MAPSQLLPPKKRPPYYGPVMFGILLRDKQMVKCAKQLAARTGKPILRGDSDEAVASRINAGCNAGNYLSRECARIFPGAHLRESKHGLYVLAFVRATKVDDSRIPPGEQLAALKQFMVGQGFDEEPRWFRDS